jgi:UDP-glucose 4-epimerase
MAYNKIINAIVTNQDFVIYGDGSQSRTNTSVFDVASATATVGERQNLNDVFNISGNEIVSLISAVRIIEGELGKEARITFLPPRPGDQMHTSGVITKAEKSLGFRPSNNFKEVIRDQIRWQIQTL